MKRKFTLSFISVMIKIHWIFIKYRRKKIDRMILEGHELLSMPVLKVDKPLNYHCSRVMEWERRYKMVYGNIKRSLI